MDREELITIASDTASELDSAVSEIEDAVYQLESIESEIDTLEEDDDSPEVVGEAYSIFSSAALGLESAVATIESAIDSLYIPGEAIPSSEEDSKRAAKRTVNPVWRHMINTNLRMSALDVELGDCDSALKSIEDARKLLDRISEEVRAIAAQKQS